MSKDTIHVKEENLEDYMGECLEISDDFEEVELNYPCVVLEGVTTSYEIDFLAHTNYPQDEALPLYVIYEGIFLALGTIGFSCESLLQLSLLDIKQEYSVKLCKAKGEEISIDIHDPYMLEKLIKL